MPAWCCCMLCLKGQLEPCAEVGILARICKSPQLSLSLSLSLVSSPDYFRSCLLVGQNHRTVVQGVGEACGKAQAAGNGDGSCEARQVDLHSSSSCQLRCDSLLHSASSVLVSNRCRSQSSGVKHYISVGDSP